MLSISKRLLALLALALLLVACGGDSTSGAKGNDADVAFLTGMKPHHEQAVEMSDIVLAAQPPEAVAAVARKIKAAQSPEIEQMDQMLKALGEDTKAKHGGGHSAGHGGMMSDADLAKLKAASGTEAARLYLTAMIVHHEGAIEASDTEIADGAYPPAIALAQQIKAAQAAEITQMRTLLRSL